jgi:PAS domain S-box-containing protein
VRLSTSSPLTFGGPKADTPDERSTGSGVADAPQEVDRAGAHEVTMSTRRLDMTPPATQAELRRETEYLSALHETALALMRRLDAHDLLEAILKRAADLAGTPHGFIYLCDAAAEEMQIKVGLGVFERHVGFRLRRGEGLSGRVWSTAEPMAVDDYDTWPGRSDQFDREVFTAIVGVPLSSGEEVVGVIGVAHVDPGRSFDADTVRLLTGFAELASIALDNARLYTEAQRELAERWRVEEELRKAEARYRDLVERLPVAVFIDSLEGVDAPSVYISPYIERLLGYTPEEWLADPELWVRSVHPEDRDRVVAAWRRHQSGGEPMIEEYRLLHRDGSEVWVRDESLVVRDSHGRPLFGQGFFLDISARKESEQQVERTVSLLRATLESTADGILVVDPGGRIVTANRKFAEMWNIPPEVMESGDDDRALAFVLDQLKDPEGFLAKVRELYASPEEESYDVLLFKDDRVFERYSQPRRVGGRPMGRVWSFRDVTARWRAEHERRESELRFRALAGSTFEGLAIHDQGEILEVNSAFLKLFGYEYDEAIGRSALDFAAPESRELVMSKIQEGSTDPYEAVGVRKDGTTFVAELMGRPIEYRGRKARVTAIRDVTQRHRAEEALREALRREQDAAERLRALDEMKNQFLAAVSHELRTPLASVFGFASTLSQPEVALSEEERQVMLGRLVANARKLDRLLSDLLDLDRLSRGIVEPSRRPTDLGNLVAGVIEETDLGGRPLHVEVSAGVANVDPAKVERMVENLLANAARHTPAGTPVWVRVWREDSGVVIAVEDAGPGVPPEERDSVFNPFSRGSGTPSHSPGTGIGLSLVARFAELHGGRAWVEERSAGGSSFRVFLPDDAR